MTYPTRRKLFGWLAAIPFIGSAFANDGNEESEPSSRYLRLADLGHKFIDLWQPRHRATEVTTDDGEKLYIWTGDEFHFLVKRDGEPVGRVCMKYIEFDVSKYPRTPIIDEQLRTPRIFA